jgi:hypothetical protein
VTLGGGGFTVVAGARLPHTIHKPELRRSLGRFDSIPFQPVYLDFLLLGTSVAAYVILLLRSLDDKGKCNSPVMNASLTDSFRLRLQIYRRLNSHFPHLIDNAVQSLSKVTPGDFMFSPNDFTPRTMLFEALILEPKLHSLSVQWSHSAGDSRPAVSVMLDTIGYLPVYVGVA